MYDARGDSDCDDDARIMMAEITKERKITSMVITKR